MSRGTLFVIVSFFYLPGALAEDIFDLAAQYNAKKNTVEDLEARKRQILSDIYSIDKDTSRVVTQKADLDDEKMDLKVKLSKLSKKIMKIEHQIRSLTPDLIERLSFAEQVDQLPWFYAFMTSQSLIEVDHLFATASDINTYQAQQVESFVALIDRLKKQKKKLDKVARAIVKTRKDIELKEKEIEKNQRAKKRILKSLEKSILSEKKRLKSIAGQGRRAVALSEFKNLGMLFGVGFFDKKGRLPHPIVAPLVHRYGLNEPLYHDQIHLTHKGYFYRATSPTPVKVVSTGKVRFAGLISGYGRVVVVDHGGRYYTTYANLKKISVKVNSEISEGTVVGQTGHSHLQFSQGLYFEIRHFSQPQNPKLWLKPQPGRLATL